MSDRCEHGCSRAHRRRVGPSEFLDCPGPSKRSYSIKVASENGQWVARWSYLGSFGATRTEALHNLANHLDRMDAWVAENFPDHVTGRAIA